MLHCCLDHETQKIGGELWVLVAKGICPQKGCIGERQGCHVSAKPGIVLIWGDCVGILASATEGPVLILW